MYNHTMSSPEVILTQTILTPLGEMLAAAHPRGICLLEFSDLQRLDSQLAGIRRMLDLPIQAGDSPLLEQLAEELAAFYSGSLRQFTVPLHFPGTDFQQRVWQLLLEIPYGETRSYEDLARMLASPGAVRAVGHANGQNRLAILIPCHRVINKDGGLGGYGGGLWRKRMLLTLEKTGVLPPAQTQPRLLD